MERNSTSSSRRRRDYIKFNKGTYGSCKGWDHKGRQPTAAT